MGERRIAERGRVTAKSLLALGGLRQAARSAAVTCRHPAHVSTSHLHRRPSERNGGRCVLAAPPRRAAFRKTAILHEYLLFWHRVARVLLGPRPLPPRGV